MTDISSLNDLGWHRRAESGHPLPTSPPHRPARVMRQESGAWLVHDGSHELLARALSRRPSVTPVTGDWVLIGDDGGTCYVHAVLPRTSTLSRNEAGRRSDEQVLAANVDVVGICTPADDVNPRRLERELTAVWSSGAAPLVVVTKADLVEDPWRVVGDVEAVCLGADVAAVSSLDGEGLESVTARLGKGTTMALIGPSGVGKSSLINALAGSPVLATAEIRGDGKGRHTTTSRQLVVLPDGGLLLDTPGMREFAPWVGEEGLAGTFADIDEMAAGCRFSDCRHESEPGCAVVIAASGDEVVAQRLASWRALQRELAWLERRHDARLRQQERRKWTALTKQIRAEGRIRP
ncbi:MAG: ribosome small subunit-dependent GTPase A [Actinobacteria bacterium]|nr:ribosome small subunit-dependent GTPase A [Actinomycetota bacterium]